MFIKVRRTFTVLAVLFLLLLFTLPSLYLKGQCEALDRLCADVLSAAQAGDKEAARASYRTMQGRYEAMRSRAELFLDHRVMDDATVPLELMGVYLNGEDALSLAAAATEFRQALVCMLSIETGDLRLLL